VTPLLNRIERKIRIITAMVAINLVLTMVLLGIALHMMGAVNAQLGRLIGVL
jgi:hypothetical protein